MQEKYQGDIAIRLMRMGLDQNEIERVLLDCDTGLLMGEMAFSLYESEQTNTSPALLEQQEGY